MIMPQNYLDYEVYRDLCELADVIEQLYDGELWTTRDGKLRLTTRMMSGISEPFVRRFAWARKQSPTIGRTSAAAYVICVRSATTWNTWNNSKEYQNETEMHKRIIKNMIEIWRIQSNGLASSKDTRSMNEHVWITTTATRDGKTYSKCSRGCTRTG